MMLDVASMASRAAIAMGRAFSAVDVEGRNRIRGGGGMSVRCDQQERRALVIARASGPQKI